MEKHDLYDLNRIPLNETIYRGQDVPDGKYRIVVHVVIFNEDGRMLIQQRQPWKTNPNKWDLTIGGSVVSGEKSGEGASRELFEEIGYSFDLSKEPPSVTIPFLYGFDDFYVIKANVNIDKLKLQSSEVRAVKWAFKEEIYKMIDDETFIGYRKSLIDLLFDFYDKRYGSWAKD